MKFVYHMVPKKMIGDELLPLNYIKGLDNELYKQYSEKYRNSPERESLLQRKIPKLDCLWNDVIFLLPLHPNYIFKSLSELGVRIKKDLLFYEIPIERLHDNLNAIYYYRKSNYKGPSSDIPEVEVEIIQIDSLHMLNAIPEDTLTYFTEESKKGTNFGMFAYIPHVLSLGKIDISGVNYVNWSKESIGK
ncbi:MAG: group-specific protein [Psychrobacillus sp.]